jgi:hypothetical protein
MLWNGVPAVLSIVRDSIDGLTQAALMNQTLWHCKRSSPLGDQARPQEN